MKGLPIKVLNHHKSKSYRICIQIWSCTIGLIMDNCPWPNAQWFFKTDFYQSLKFLQKDIENWRSFFSMKITMAFIWGSIYFCTTDGFFRILKKALSELICTRLFVCNAWVSRISDWSIFHAMVAFGPESAESSSWLQLNENETDPYFLQLSQNMATNCLFNFVLCFSPVLTWIYLTPWVTPL